MRIAIIGAGLSGLSCALECEKLGVVPEVFERESSIGWPWTSVNFWPEIFYRNIGDPVQYVRNNFNVELTPLNICKTIIMKSADREVKIRGKLGYLFLRGKGDESKENQLVKKLKRGTGIHFNSRVDYKKLAADYDYVVVATGRDSEARELNVWEDKGIMYVYGGNAIGKFHDETSTIFLNTEYAGSGYARITPYSPTQAIVALYDDRHDEFDTDMLFTRFLKYEDLEELEFTYKLVPPPFTTGRVKKFQVGNVLLIGRSAGLTDRFLGVGGPEAIISGVLAARAMILEKNYESLIKHVQKHVENISVFRDVIKDYQNKDFNRLLSLLGTPGIKQAAYNTPINIMDSVGRVLKLVKH